MDFNVIEAVRSRRSVRSFDGVALSEEDRRAVIDYVNNIMTPFSVPLCFRMLDHAGAERNEKLDTKGIVTGTELYLAITVPKSAPMNLEAAGYAFEQLVLYAASRGIGTTIIAGTMDRVGFERAVHLAADEVMPVMTPLGRAGKPTLRERAMRRAIKADSRRDWSELFFDGDFSTPLSKEAAGAYRRSTPSPGWCCGRASLSTSSSAMAAALARIPPRTFSGWTWASPAATSTWPHRRPDFTDTGNTARLPSPSRRTRITASAILPRNNTI